MKQTGKHIAERINRLEAKVEEFQKALEELEDTSDVESVTALLKEGKLNAEQELKEAQEATYEKKDRLDFLRQTSHEKVRFDRRIN